MTPYYVVTAFFVAVMVGAFYVTFFDPKKTAAQNPIIDETSIMVHNGQSNSFTQASNLLFQVSPTLLKMMY